MCSSLPCMKGGRGIPNVWTNSGRKYKVKASNGTELAQVLQNAENQLVGHMNVSVRKHFPSTLSVT